jgi:hypothetical protein
MQTHQRISDEAICDVLYKVAGGMAMSEEEKNLLDQWTAQSPYNLSLSEEIKTDTKLRLDLYDAYFTDRSQFWKIVITYRAALHDGIPYGGRNFWQRIFYFFRKMFSRRTK